jgi:prefoldin subunit 5
MNNGLRNTLIGGLITVVLTFVGAWIQVNNRISVLEVQMDTYVKAQQKTDADMDKVMDKLTDIQNNVTRLNTEFEIEHGKQGYSK